MPPIGWNDFVVAVLGTICHAYNRSLRKPRLAQAVIEALAILGALADLRKDRLVDCEPWVDTQRFGGLLPRFVQLTQLGIGGGQIATAVTVIRCARRRRLQLRQGVRIAPEQII